MGVCNCSMFCCTLRYIHSSTAIILMGKRELVALLNLSSLCLVVVGRLFLAVPRGCLIVVYPDHTHLLFFLLGFVKGLDTIPSLVFDQSPRLKFRHPNPVDEYDDYANILTVPVFMSDYDLF